MSLDIYGWIPSLEVAEHLRQNRTFTVTEKYQLIHDAPRPLEEKLEALLNLEAEASKEREKKFMSRAIEVYRLVLRLMEEQPSGSFFLVKAFSDTDELVGAIPYATFTQVLEQAANDKTVSSYLAEFWQKTTNGGLTNPIEYHLLPLNGQLRATDFWIDDVFAPNTDDLFDSKLYLRRLLPFENGDLFCLEVDGVSRHGFFYQELDGNGTLYAYLGYLHDGYLDSLELGENAVLTLNWTRLHSFHGELPPEEGILREIGDLMKRLGQQDPMSVEKLFWDTLFNPISRLRGESSLFPYRITPLKLAELLEEAHCVKYQEYLETH
ncbi:SMI1/KNR4 family protein [Caproiciproducens faecalis]|uniref:Uncharacterized protein n=1 Tax=Caproiciproducens faecalis TaxID=2820301 RepID=A0ABS7DKY8_9FIRM|nr:SMI1/KNR4 family protein [Caproiciproducens faecalis]MBW7571950.1 hypothetical protein [Caproiciproducens faecalis]